MIGSGHRRASPSRAIARSRCCTGTCSGVAGSSGPRTWAAQRAGDLDRKPDLVVLSEAPPRRLARSARRRPRSGRLVVGLHTTRGAPTGIEWPCARDGRSDVEKHLGSPAASGMSVLREVRGRPLRLLVVDGISSPTRSRIARSCGRSRRPAARPRRQGRPYDLVLGDFNTPSRSLGFAELEALGYRLAGRSARGWRGTFPAWLPVYDIDHVWLAPGLAPRLLHVLQRSEHRPPRTARPRPVAQGGRFHDRSRPPSSPPARSCSATSHLGAESSVWYNAVLRGDTDRITIGEQTNIQDLTMIHADPGSPAPSAAGSPSATGSSCTAARSRTTA